MVIIGYTRVQLNDYMIKREWDLEKKSIKSVIVDKEYCDAIRNPRYSSCYCKCL